MFSHCTRYRCCLVNINIPECRISGVCDNSPCVICSSCPPCNRSTNYSNIFNASSICISKEPCAISSHDGKVFYLIKVTIKLFRKRCRNRTSRRECRFTSKINIILQHIILSKIRAHISKFARRTYQLVVVICCHRICAIDLVCRRSRFCPTLIPDMRIAVIYRCIRMEDNGTGRRIMNICRIEDADTPAVDLNLIRRDRAHIDDIGFANICHGCAEWRCPAARERRRVQRRFLLCRDIEIPYVHGC